MPDLKLAKRNRVASFFAMLLCLVGACSAFSQMVLPHTDQAREKGRSPRISSGQFRRHYCRQIRHKKDKEIPYKAEHVGVRAHKIMFESELAPGEYAFFMGTSQQATMASGGGSTPSGGRRPAASTNGSRQRLRLGHIPCSSKSRRSPVDGQLRKTRCGGSGHPFSKGPPAASVRRCCPYRPQILTTSKS